ncbi:MULTISPECIES: permease [unclassified Streptomyces]|uniref:permease n=1 Tax=unclassified Streptomyces TaxID=2593676 RepID=UPI002E2B4356|nr:permease [Streptomyces sp. NBC_00441]
MRTVITLLRIGLAAGRSTPGDRLRWWVLVVAAATVAFVAVATAGTVATYEGRKARSDARGVVFAEGRDAPLLYRPGGDSIDGHPVSVVFVYPMTEDAPVPAGVRHWPEPGGVLLSPELVRTGRSEGVLTRYGTFSGTVEPAGLASPSERIAYVRVASLPTNHAQWVPVSAFGGRGGSTGEMRYEWPLNSTLLMLWALAGVPALALTVVAARVGSRSRDRRSGLLQALGGVWWHRAVVNLGEAVFPAALGAAFALVPYTIAACWNLRLPPTGYILDHRDLWARWPAAAAIAAGALVLVLAIVVGTHRVYADGTSNRPASAASGVPRWRLAACGGGAALVVLSQYAPSGTQLAIYCCGTVTMWAFLSSVVAVLTRRLGARLADGGKREGHPGRLVGGRWTHAHPGVIVRLALAMVIGIGILTQMQIWTSRLADQELAVRLTKERIEDTVIELTVPAMDAAQTDRLRAALPPGSALLTHTLGDPGKYQRPRITVQGTCRDLRVLDIDCQGNAASSAIQAQEMRRWYGADLTFAPVSRVTAKPGGTQFLVVVTPEPGHLAEVKHAAYTLPTPAVQVMVLGGVWETNDRARLVNWIRLFGSAGLFFVLLAGGVSAAAEFIRVRQVLAPLSVLTGHRRIFRSVSTWYLTVPLLIATAVTTVVTAWHAVFFIALVNEGTVSWTILGAGAAACALVSLAVGHLAARAAARAADQWVPTAD